MQPFSYETLPPPPGVGRELRMRFSTLNIPGNTFPMSAKLGCDFVTTEALTDPTWSSGTGVALQSCLELRQPVSGHRLSPGRAWSLGEDSHQRPTLLVAEGMSVLVLKRGCWQGTRAPIACCITAPNSWSPQGTTSTPITPIFGNLQPSLEIGSIAFAL